MGIDFYIVRLDSDHRNPTVVTLLHTREMRVSLSEHTLLHGSIFKLHLQIMSWLWVGFTLPTSLMWLSKTACVHLMYLLEICKYTFTVSGSKQASKDTHKDMCKAVSPVWGSLRLTPLISYSYYTLPCNHMYWIIYGVVMKFGGLVNRHPRAPITWPITVKYLGIFCRVKMQVQ